jgi:hypothetical protein
VDDDEEVVLEGEDDAFAQPLYAGNGAALAGVEGRGEGAEHERGLHPGLEQGLAEGALLDRLHVDHHVGQLGHEMRRIQVGGRG